VFPADHQRIALKHSVMAITFQHHRNIYRCGSDPWASLGGKLLVSVLLTLEATERCKLEVAAFKSYRSFIRWFDRVNETHHLFFFRPIIERSLGNSDGKSLAWK
jgi:hypothetical protein